MTKWILAAGAAALALTTPALAGPDKGPKGGGGEQDRGNKGGGGGGKQGGGDKHGGGGGKHGGGGGGGGGQMRADHGGGKKADRQEARADRGNGNDKKSDRQVMRFDGGNQRADRQIARSDRGDKQAFKAERKYDKAERKAEQRAESRGGRDFADDGRNLRSFDDDRRGGDSLFGRNFAGFADNCPPGLAKKNNGCLPPGQAKKYIGAVLPAALGGSLLDGPYRQWYQDNDRYYYRDDGDYIYRVNREGGLIDALFPFQDRDYSYYDVGSQYPADYNFYNVPQQYQSFYPDGNDYNYRYGDGAIYQVNRSDSTINSIVALLAGDLGVGQQMPSDYGVYNVPMAYRDRYYDTPEASYRYNDGYIYQADPKTQLITAVIDALV